MDRPTKRMTSYRLPETLRQRIEARAQDEETTASEIVRRALRWYLDERPRCPHTYPQDKGAQP